MYVCLYYLEESQDYHHYQHLVIYSNKQANNHYDYENVTYAASRMKVYREEQFLFVCLFL